MNFNNNNFIVSSPFENFEVNSLIHIQSPLLGYTTVSLTNIGLYTIIAVYVIVYIHRASSNNLLIPSRWGIIIESIYDTVYSILESQIGSNQQKYFALLYSIFIFILVSNLLGNVTYSFAITASLVVTLGISFIIFIGVTILSIYIHGIKFLTFFVPSGVPSYLLPLIIPIEIVSYIARSVSLGTRLFSNIFAGHTLISILSSFLAAGLISSFLVSTFSLVGFVIFIAIVALEIAVAFIQAYVFTVLTASYIKDSIYLHL